MAYGLFRIDYVYCAALGKPTISITALISYLLKLTLQRNKTLPFVEETSGKKIAESIFTLI